ncbi:hypothetical protein HW555_005338 [Spodoptera exigua]|uniref:Uncharacterized protein n=1 Tax=Spodoptera exigua TaxID=7107 RepID=A0A835GK04_SPOEX|nr:hypothetical protein HW555_005338 [Spodoptera exigua]
MRHHFSNQIIVVNHKTVEWRVDIVQIINLECTIIVKLTPGCQVLFLQSINEMRPRVKGLHHIEGIIRMHNESISNMWKEMSTLAEFTLYNVIMWERCDSKADVIVETQDTSQQVTK